MELQRDGENVSLIPFDNIIHVFGIAFHRCNVSLEGVAEVGWGQRARLSQVKAIQRPRVAAPHVNVVQHVEQRFSPGFQ